MAIEIDITKIYEGKKLVGVHVDRVKALTYSELPKEYKNPPNVCVWLSINGFLTCESLSESLYPGQTYSPEFFYKRHAYIKKAGNRLKEINDKIRKEEKAGRREVKEEIRI